MGEGRSECPLGASQSLVPAGNPAEEAPVPPDGKSHLTGGVQDSSCPNQRTLLPEVGNQPPGAGAAVAAGRHTQALGDSVLEGQPGSKQGDQSVSKVRSEWIKAQDRIEQ